jgi:hypothetical protein
VLLECAERLDSREIGEVFVHRRPFTLARLRRPYAPQNRIIARAAAQL